ncbi:hypothetical protein [Citrobacter freundii]|uniref:Phage protein n=1 Tax=Citrobacter freundii TaxID=546 RepID=A0AA40TIH2_CITFR|nr:hypothetical protein [Citrobacter freundii]KPR49870.1 hypothetical protein AN672_23855 [Citrobacter freundii]
MSNREEFEYEAGQELKLPVSIIKQARMGDGYDHAFDSMNVMQPLNQWWHWWQAGREGMDKKFTDMTVQLANAESKCRELAAENVGLKNFIIKDCHVAHIEPETFYEEEVTRYVSADGYEPETPATEAFLAEVRAQGVEMFAEQAAKSLSGGYVIVAKEFTAQLRKGAAL